MSDASQGAFPVPGTHSSKGQIHVAKVNAPQRADNLSAQYAKDDSGPSKVTFGEYAADWIRSRIDLAERTGHLAEALVEIRSRHPLQTEAASQMQTTATESLGRALRAESTCAAIRSTRTWRMHDWYVGSRAGRWLSRPAEPVRK